MEPHLVHLRPHLLSGMICMRKVPWLSMKLGGFGVWSAVWSAEDVQNTWALDLTVYIYVYIYIFMYIFTCIYIYIYLYYILQMHSSYSAVHAASVYRIPLRSICYWTPIAPELWGDADFRFLVLSVPCQDRNLRGVLPNTLLWEWFCIVFHGLRT